MGGFTILNVILMNIGRKVYGIVGIVLLGLIPAWYILVSYAEGTGQLQFAGNLGNKKVSVDADGAHQERGGESGGNVVTS